MKSRMSAKFTCALVIFSLIGQIAWVVENMYLNVFIYKMFNATAADISAMVAASAVAATLTTVFIGALSDNPLFRAYTSRYNRGSLPRGCIRGGGGCIPRYNPRLRYDLLWLERERRRLQCVADR